MNSVKMVRWWPVVGITALVLLGLAVGPASTGIDDWFLQVRHEHHWVWFLLLFTDARLVVGLFLVALLIAAYRRRWRLAAVVAVTPVVAVVAVRLLKRVFGREKVGALAYPSGHVTVSLVVLGLLVVVLGAQTWKVAAALVVVLLGLLGQSFTFHYFTDTVGAVFLGTSLLCLAVPLAKLDRCQPRCDLDHSSG